MRGKKKEKKKKKKKKKKFLCKVLAFDFEKFSRIVCRFASFILFVLFSLFIFTAGNFVWILGSSIIRWAAHAALISEGGLDFNLFEPGTVRWIGRSGMRWCHFFQKITDLHASCTCVPQILIIHLGGNDLSRLSLYQLNLLITSATNFIHQHWPTTQIALSAIIPRRSYKGARRNKAMDGARKAINRHMRKVMTNCNGIFIPHPTFHFRNSELYLDDGVHLSGKGNQQLLTDISNALQQFLSQRALV